MSCPLCGSRKAKRYCSGKAVQICTVCCATKREIEIDCPTSCSYLREGYHYHQEKALVLNDPQTAPPEKIFDRRFLIHNEPFLMTLWQIIWESCKSIPSVHDADVLGALMALERTYQTLDKGLYYESRPEDGTQQILYAELKETIDRRLQQPDVLQEHLKVSTVLECLQFQQQFLRMKTSGRALSRGFLMQLESIFGEPLSSTPGTGSRIVLA